MKNILLFSTGLSPQIVTESLFYYTQIKKPALKISEIHIITDKTGANLIKFNLLDAANGWYYKFCKDYHINPEEINFSIDNINLLRDKNGEPLNDLLSISENTAAVNEIFTIIRDLTNKNDSRLITSVAGGRKTMSVIVGQAMQFFARKQDSLTHVIVDESLFRANDFYYPTPKTKIVNINGKDINYNKVKIHLDEIPFIKLRPIVKDVLPELSNKDFMSVVTIAQKQIEDLIKPIEIKVIIHNKQLTINGKNINLPDKNFAIYVLLLNYKKNKYSEEGGDLGFIQKDKIIEEEILYDFFKFYSQIGSVSRSFLQDEKMRIQVARERTAFYTTQWIQETRSKINATLKKNLNSIEYSLCHIESRGERFNTMYGIAIDSKNVAIKNQG